jgi:hypothetical protein
VVCRCHRVGRSVLEPLKARGPCEADHLIPVELGGPDIGIANLLPEPAEGQAGSRSDQGGHGHDREDDGNGERSP